MKILMDAYGGDNAPLEVLRGARMAVDEYGVTVVLCGRETELREVAGKSGVALAGIEIADAPDAMPMAAEPTELLKTYKESSMAVGFRLLAEGSVDALVSAGNTGALLVGATMVAKRIKGVKRPAIGTVVPSAGGGYMLMDSGANVECRPEMLLQFGIMGSAYMQRMMGVKNPRVGVLNIGTEEGKGTQLQHEAAKLLRQAPLNYIGYVEPRVLPLGGCDVAVCDGFVGNIVLKLTEGMGKLIANELKGMLTKSAVTKLAALLLQSGLKEFKANMDYAEHGGAPLMGVKKPVIKAHGSSNAKAFKNAVRQAKTVCETGVIAQIEEALAALPAASQGEEV